MKRLIMLAALPALLLAGCAAQPAPSGTETLGPSPAATPCSTPSNSPLTSVRAAITSLPSMVRAIWSCLRVERASRAGRGHYRITAAYRGIYLVSSSAMDPIISIDGLDTVALSSTQADNWYLDAAKTAMENGQIAYAGKYSAPDYETILAANCGLAIENTMIHHTPEVKEQLEKFGCRCWWSAPATSGPLARMEWVKLYGVLLGKTTRPSRSLTTPCSALHRWKMNPPPAKPWRSSPSPPIIWPLCARAGDYVAKMIEMAGGDYVFSDLTDSGNNLATRQHLAGGFLRQGQGRRCADLQQHHRGRDPHDGRVDRQMPAAGAVQGRAAGATSGAPRKAFSSKAWRCPT